MFLFSWNELNIAIHKILSVLNSFVQHRASFGAHYVRLLSVEQCEIYQFLLHVSILITSLFVLQFSEFSEKASFKFESLLIINTEFRGYSLRPR